MTPLAVTLVLASAVAHATWNLLAKHASTSRTFSWLCVLAAAVVTAPLALLQLASAPGAVRAEALVFPAISGIIHVGYFATLARAYRVGDLSLVYPLARGSGPLLAVLVAVAILGERPSLPTLGGIAAILVGVLCLTGDPRALRGSRSLPGIGLALATGVLIAAYTTWDKIGVSVGAVPPIVYFCVLMLVCGIGLTPWALGDPRQARRELAQHWRLALVAGALIALAYVLVLTAMVTSPVSSVAPMREIGILIGAVLGQRLLAEGQTRARLAGAVAMVIGVSLLAVG